jgi:uncharacterized repeat protein (TIGR03803 family)
MSRQPAKRRHIHLTILLPSFDISDVSPSIQFNPSAARPAEQQNLQRMMKRMKMCKRSRIFAVVVTLIFLLSLFRTLGMEAQASQSRINQLFAFACDSTGKICPDGRQPTSLIESADGNFYGTTAFGGVGNQAAGTVFKITSAGQLTLIYTFVADQNGHFLNGANPSRMIEGNDGFLYGAAMAGGANNLGVVFKLSKTGAIQVLHSFCSLANCADGDEPFDLVLGNDGNLYGATTYSFPGTLFRITPSGSYTLLHTFATTVDGPQSIGMTLASDGNIYGTTVGRLGFPTVLFRLTPAGHYDVLHKFRYPVFPTTQPVQAADGKLYGLLDAHVLFVSSLSGSSFGETFVSPFKFPDFLQYLTPASDSNLWSILFKNGVGPGALAKISRKASLLATVPFEGTNGTDPVAPILQSSDGKLLGVTMDGGSVGQGQVGRGVVFSFDAGLAPPKPRFVRFNPSQGKVGSKVVIQGLHFAAARAVTFNGVSATFQVLNTSNILATVPSGATTGPIAVTNAGGTTASKKNFVVD